MTAVVTAIMAVRSYTDSNSSSTVLTEARSRKRFNSSRKRADFLPVSLSSSRQILSERYSDALPLPRRITARSSGVKPYTGLTSIRGYSVFAELLDKLRASLLL